MSLLYAIIIFAHVIWLYTQQCNKGPLVPSIQLWYHLYQATPKRSTYVHTFQINASVWGNFTVEIFMNVKECAETTSCLFQEFRQTPQLDSTFFDILWERYSSWGVSLSPFSAVYFLEGSCTERLTCEARTEYVLVTSGTTPKRSTFRCFEETVLPFEVISVCYSLIFREMWNLKGVPDENVTETTPTNSTCQIFNTGQCHC